MLMKYLFYALVLSVSFHLCGCGAGDENDSEYGDRTRVVFWHAMGGPLGKVLESMIDDFNKTHPQIYVKGVSMGQYDTLEKKILASVVARESPDISQNFETLTLRLARAKKLARLDDLMGDEAEEIKSDIIPILLENNTFDGKLWSFPFNKSVPVLYYNKELFRNAGLDPESPPETVWELLDYARKLTEDHDGDGRPEIWGYAFQQRNAWNFECRLLQFGGRLIEKNRNAVSYNSDWGVETLNFYLSFLKENLGYTVPGYEHQNDFIAQKVAMIESSIVSRVYMLKNIDFDFGVAPLPAAHEKAVVISGTNINIFDNHSEEKIKGAWEFVRWFTDTEQQVRWSLETTYIPVRQSSLEHPGMIEAFDKDPSLKAPYVQLEYAQFEPRLTSWYDCRNRLSAALEQCYISVCEPKETLDRVVVEINDILASSEE